MGYEDHGLTRAEDDILGAFGSSQALGDLEEEVVPLTHFAHYSHGEAAKSLIRKGLLNATVSADLGVQLSLTPKGLKLWDIRYREEAAGPSPRER